MEQANGTSENKRTRDDFEDEDHDNNERASKRIKTSHNNEELLDPFADVMSRICTLLELRDALVALSVSKRFGVVRLDYIWKSYGRALRASRPSLTRKTIKEFLEMAVVKKDGTVIYAFETLHPGGLWLYDGNLAFSIHDKHYEYDLKTQNVTLRTSTSEREKMLIELTLYPSCWGVREFYALQDRLFCFKDRESEGFTVYKNKIQEFIYDPYYDQCMMAESSYGCYSFHKRIRPVLVGMESTRDRIYANMECLAYDVEKSLVYGLKCYDNAVVLYVFEKTTMKTLKEHVITRGSSMKLPRLGFVKGNSMIMVSSYEVHVLDVQELRFLDWQAISVQPFNDKDVSALFKQIDQSLRFVYYYLEEVYSDGKRMICWDTVRLTIREIILPDVEIFNFVIDPYLGLNGRCYYRVDGIYAVRTFDVVYK